MGGKVGRTLGAAWLRSGHEVRFGSRTPEEVDVPGTADLPSAAAAWADVVVLTVPGLAAPEVLTGLGSTLDGKIVVDATNRTGAGEMNNLALIAAVAPGSRACRAFSTVGWEVMADPTFGTRRASLFHCGPETARGTMDGLIADVGFDPVWVGEADQAALIDGLTRLWGTLAIRRGLGRHLALALLADGPGTPTR